MEAAAAACLLRWPEVDGTGDTTSAGELKAVQTVAPPLALV